MDLWQCRNKAEIKECMKTSLLRNSGRKERQEDYLVCVFAVCLLLGEKCFWGKNFILCINGPVKSAETRQVWEKLCNTTPPQNDHGLLSGLQCNALTSLVLFVITQQKWTRDASALHWKPERSPPLMCIGVVLKSFFLSLLDFIEVGTLSFTFTRCERMVGPDLKIGLLPNHLQTFLMSSLSPVRYGMHSTGCGVASLLGSHTQKCYKIITKIIHVNTHSCMYMYMYATLKSRVWLLLYMCVVLLAWSGPEHVGKRLVLAVLVHKLFNKRTKNHGCNDGWESTFTVMRSYSCHRYKCNGGLSVGWTTLKQSHCTNFFDDATAHSSLLPWWWLFYCTHFPWWWLCYRTHFTFALMMTKASGWNVGKINFCQKVGTMRRRLHDAVFVKSVLNPFSIRFPSARIWSVYTTPFLLHSNTHDTWHAGVSLGNTCNNHVTLAKLPGL